MYVLVRGIEYADVESRDHVVKTDETEKEIVRAQRQSFEARVNISGAEELEAGKEYEWTGVLSFPDGVQPTFRGQMVRHLWQVQAGLDAFGNDPDSGWQEFEVR